MSADALISKVDAGRKKRAQGLRVQILFLDLDTGKVRAKVLSSSGSGTYNVRFDLKKRTCRCECPDFERHLQPCKHLAATGMVVKQIIAGHVLIPEPVLIPKED